MPVLQPGRPGQELLWSWLNDLLKLARGNRINLGPNSGLAMIQSPGVGTFLRVTRTPRDLFVGIVLSPGITVRSGLTLGSGPVEIYTKDPSTGAYVDSGTQINVDSVSSFAGGIPAGCWVTCGYQADGTATLLNVDYGA
jgi:hypothetical protein